MSIPRTRTADPLSSENCQFIVISNESWGDIWFSKQHYAFELAKLGYRVYFINPQPKWRLANLFSWSYQEKWLNENLCIIDFKNLLPVISPFIVHINDFFNCIKLKSISRKGRLNIHWQFDPNRFVKFLLRPTKRIYHVVDPYDSIWADSVLAAKSDLIVCSSREYLDHYSRKSSNVIFIPHGVSSEQMLIDQQKRETIRNEFGEYFVFVGAIIDDIDFNLLEKIVKQFSIVMIGPIQIKDPDKMEHWMSLENSESLHYLGVMHVHELNSYIGASIGGLLLYRFDHKAAVGVRSPLKVLNYLAQEKPVISSIDHEVGELDGKGIFSARNEDEFMKFLTQVKDMDLFHDKESIQSYLSDNSYPKLIKKALKVLIEAKN